MGKNEFLCPGRSNEEHTYCPPPFLKMKIFFGLLAFVGICFLYPVAPLWVLIYWAAICVITFIIFAADKISAIRGVWRVAEKTLHFLSAIGGSLGILLGEITFGHKRSKSAFNRIFYPILILQILIVSGITFFLHNH